MSSSSSNRPVTSPTMSPLPIASFNTVPVMASTPKSQPGMAAAASAANTPGGLSTPPTSPPIRALTRSLTSAAVAPPAVEGQQQQRKVTTRLEHRHHTVYDNDNSYCASAHASSPSTSVDRAVRSLMAELDASIFRNVSSAISAFFLDINDVGHFVSMPHLGACACPEANHIMRLIEETLTRHAGYLLDPMNRTGLEAFGDALARRVGSDLRVLTPLAKVLIVLRVGHTATAARQGHHPAVVAMVPEFPLFLDAHVQIQARKIGGSTFASTCGSAPAPPSPTSETESDAPSTLAVIAEDPTSAGCLRHRSTSLHASPASSAHAQSAQVHFASPPASPSATTQTFGMQDDSPLPPGTAPEDREPTLGAPAPGRCATATKGSAARKRTMSLPVTSPAHAHAHAHTTSVAALRPKTEVAVVLESMISERRAARNTGRHPVYLLHVQDAAATANAPATPLRSASFATSASVGSFMP